jgi:hypothetical protein
MKTIMAANNPPDLFELGQVPTEIAPHLRRNSHASFISLLKILVGSVFPLARPMFGEVCQRLRGISKHTAIQHVG